MSLILDSNPELQMIDQKSFPWQQRILDAMRTRVDDAIQHPLTIPTQAGGWWHQYVCPEHELPLIFDATSSGLHRCPKGCSHLGESYDAAFRVFAHRHYAALARDAAVLYQATSETQYLVSSLGILAGYADLYTYFEGGENSEPWMLSGKAFQQALTEAIWSIPLIQAFEILSPNLTASQVDQLTSNLLRPIAETLTIAHEKLVFQQDRLASNYNAWLIAALGCLGFALDDEARIERAVDGPGGFIAHLNAAILADGFEYEGSPYYHNFVAWAYTLLAEAARSHSVDLYAIRSENSQSIQGMWRALATLTWPDGGVPLLHDGNHWQNSSYDTELCEVYEIALARTGDTRYAWLLDRAYQRRGTERDSWSALLFANSDIQNSLQPAMDSTYLKEIGVGVLRDASTPDGLAALLRFGPHGSGHTHRDCLALLLFPCSLDAGNPPYGVDTRRSWYQQSAAHNIVLVDGQSQAPEGGELLSWQANHNRSEIHAAANQAYTGVEFSRQIALEAEQITDHAKLSADSERTFDWLFHIDTAPTCEGVDLSPVQGNLFDDGAAAAIQIIAKGNCADTLQAIFEQQGQRYRLTLFSPSPMEIFLARSPQRGGVDMDQRYTLVARVLGHQANFFATYEKL